MAIKTTVKKNNEYTVEDVKIKEKKQTEKKTKKINKKEKEEGFLKSCFNELKKVTWPSGKITFKYTITTIIFCVLFGLFFFIFDLLFLLLKGLFN